MPALQNLVRNVETIYRKVKEAVGGDLRAVPELASLMYAALQPPDLVWAGLSRSDKGYVVVEIAEDGPLHTALNDSFGPDSFVWRHVQIKEA